MVQLSKKRYGQTTNCGTSKLSSGWQTFQKQSGEFSICLDADATRHSGWPTLSQNSCSTLSTLLHTQEMIEGTGYDIGSLPHSLTFFDFDWVNRGMHSDWFLLILIGFSTREMTPKRKPLFVVTTYRNVTGNELDESVLKLHE